MTRTRKKKPPNIYSKESKVARKKTNRIVRHKNKNKLVLVDKDTEIVLLDSGYKYFWDKEHPLATWIESHEQVHHIDGNKDNNNPENLIILTKSQHTMIHNPAKFSNCKYCNKEFKITDKNRIHCSAKCSGLTRRKVKNRPSNEQIIMDLQSMSYIAVGKKYGVSDNAIRKWLTTSNSLSIGLFSCRLLG